jgi:predicted TIM-barrel fold metal-dependent hydrolase
MLNGYQIIDADCHVFEPADMWINYLEPAFKDFAPIPPGMKIKGEKIYNKISSEVHQHMVRKVGENHPTLFSSNGFDPESQLVAMGQMKIDVSFLYPSIGLWVLTIDTMPPQLAGAFTRAYNNWLRDFCSYKPEVLKGVGAINLHAPEEMVSELHRIVKFGWKAVFLCPNPIKGRLLSDPAYELFWTECEELGVAVGLHECGTHGRLPTTGADRFNTQFAMHACSHPMEQMMALLALIEGGVLERHPKLRVAFLESGGGWLPYWLWRLDEEYEKLYWEVKENVKIKPSEYFRRQCFVSIEPSEPYLSEIIDYIGSDNLLFGSDYPHWDHSRDIVKQVINLEQKLSRKTVNKIVWDNPACFYGFT